MHPGLDNLDPLPSTGQAPGTRQSMGTIKKSRECDAENATVSFLDYNPDETQSRSLRVSHD